MAGYDPKKQAAQVRDELPYSKVARNAPPSAPAVPIRSPDKPPSASELNPYRASHTQSPAAARADLGAARMEAEARGKNTFFGGLGEVVNRFIPQVPQAALQQAQRNRDAVGSAAYESDIRSVSLPETTTTPQDVKQNLAQARDNLGLPNATPYELMRTSVPREGSQTVKPPRNLGGEFVGAATDMQATRAMQARVEQDQDAAYMAQSLNRAAEAERDNRATKLGISRNTLDGLEGRSNGSGNNSMGSIDPAPGPFDRPGDGFGDAGLRRAEYNSLLQNAANTRGISKVKRSAMLDAAEKLIEPGRAAMGYSAEQQKNAAANARAISDQQVARMQEAAANQRAFENNKTTLAAAQINQLGQNQRTEYSERSRASQEAVKNLNDSFKAGSDYLVKVTRPDGNNPPLVDLGKLTRFREGLNKAQLAGIVGEEVADRIKAGRLHPEEAQQLVAAAKQWDENPKSIWNLYMAEVQFPQYTNAPPLK